MVVSSFITLQLGLCILSLAVVYGLHARKLRRESVALFEAWNTSRTEIDSVASEPARIAWINARGAEIEPQDLPSSVRKVVFECEGKDPKRLNNQLKPYVFQQTLKDQWNELRNAQAEQIVALAADKPAQARAALETFTKYALIDKVTGFTAPAWPELPEVGVDESEALHAEIAALKAELQSVTAGTDEDLRKLLKQFTQDSREMMGCIQTLEKENQALKDQIEKAAA